MALREAEVELQNPVTILRPKNPAWKVTKKSSIDVEHRKYRILPFPVAFLTDRFLVFSFRENSTNRQNWPMAQYKAAMLRIFGEGATKPGTAATSSSTSQFATTETTTNGTLQPSQEEDVDDGSNRRYEDVCDGNNNMQSNQAIHQQPPPMIKYIRESWVSKSPFLSYPLTENFFYQKLSRILLQINDLTSPCSKTSSPLTPSLPTPLHDRQHHCLISFFP